LDWIIGYEIHHANLEWVNGKGEREREGGKVREIFLNNFEFL
jgi:hypothetical protein